MQRVTVQVLLREEKVTYINVGTTRQHTLPYPCFETSRFTLSSLLRFFRAAA